MTIAPEQALAVFGELQRAYQLAFNTAAGKTVMADLGKICRAWESTAVPGDHDRTWTLIGRREVYLYIRDYLDLPTEQLVAKYTRPAKGAISHDDHVPTD